MIKVLDDCFGDCQKGSHRLVEAYRDQGTFYDTVVRWCEIREMPAADYVVGSTVNAAEHQNVAHVNMLWRYLALFDQDVEVVLSRDSDSRVSPREADSVNEWLQRDEPIHTMYDNLCHTNSIIMCGLTGWKADRVRRGWKSYENYQKILDFFYQWYITEGYANGLRLVHFDNWVVNQLLIRPFGESAIYRCGTGTTNPLKVPMPADNSCGDHLGSCVGEELRYQEWTQNESLSNGVR